MITIYKYPLQETGVPGECTVRMPKGAKIISVIEQNDEPVVYAIVNTEQELQTRKFYVFGTGWDLTDQADRAMDFIGSLTTDHGMFVWHVFVGRVGPC